MVNGVKQIADSTKSIQKTIRFLTWIASSYLLAMTTKNHHYQGTKIQKKPHEAASY